MRANSKTIEWLTRKIGYNFHKNRRLTAAGGPIENDLASSAETRRGNDARSFFGHGFGGRRSTPSVAPEPQPSAAQLSANLEIFEQISPLGFNSA